MEDLPKLEKAIRALEAGWTKEKVIEMYGEELYEEALTWLEP